MCFSAQASFAAGAVLTVVGVATQRKVSKPAQILLAAVPLILAVQQFAEGVLWTILPGGAYPGLEKIASHIFLVIARTGWPLIIPIALLLLEEDKKRRSAIFACLAAGVISSFGFGCSLLFYNRGPEISGHHILYPSSFPVVFSVISHITYFLSTILPLFISSIKKVHLLGILMAVSCIVAAIFFLKYLTSVWCFFAAILSIVIYYIISESEKELNNRA